MVDWSSKALFFELSQMLKDSCTVSPIILSCTVAVAVRGSCVAQSYVAELSIRASCISSAPSGQLARLDVLVRGIVPLVLTARLPRRVPAISVIQRAPRHHLPWQIRCPRPASRGHQPTRRNRKTIPRARTGRSSGRAPRSKTSPPRTRRGGGRARPRRAWCALHQLHSARLPVTGMGMSEGPGLDWRFRSFPQIRITTRARNHVCRAGVASSRNSRSLPYGSSMHALRETILGRHRIARTGSPCSREIPARTGNVGRAREARRACRSGLGRSDAPNSGPNSRSRCVVLEMSGFSRICSGFVQLWRPGHRLSTCPDSRISGRICSESRQDAGSGCSGIRGATAWRDRCFHRQLNPPARHMAHLQWHKDQLVPPPTPPSPSAAAAAVVASPPRPRHSAWARLLTCFCRVLI